MKFSLLPGVVVWFVNQEGESTEEQARRAQSGFPSPQCLQPAEAAGAQTLMSPSSPHQTSVSPAVAFPR